MAASLSLLIGKFIPGVGTMAAPLAGKHENAVLSIPRLDFLGASLYALSYGAVGFIFRDLVAKIVSGFRAAGHVVEIVIIIAVIAFIGYRVSLYWKQRGDRVVPRVEVQILAAKLQTEGRGKILLADVRRHGYYIAGAVRIPGSIRVEPNNLSADPDLHPALRRNQSDIDSPRSLSDVHYLRNC